MTTAIKRRRGTTVQHSTFTGLEGEITIDTTKDTAVVHDGATAGGFPLAKESGSAIAATTLSVSGAFSANGGATLGDASGDALTINSSAVSIPNGLTFNSGAVTLSSNPTLSGGTANGVLYLNGSKVATSGSALTFSGTQLSVIGGNAGQLLLDNGNQQYTQLLMQRNSTINTGGDILVALWTGMGPHARRPVLAGIRSLVHR